MKGTESAKNTFGYWWTFFLYATTNIHLAASFFVYNKLLPWSPNPKRQIFFQMTFFLSFSHISNAENFLILLYLHWVSKGWIENWKRMNFEYFGTQAHLTYCTKCCHKNYFVLTTIRIKVKSLIKKFRKNFTFI